jgi:hypothetical protein
MRAQTRRLTAQDLADSPRLAHFPPHFPPWQLDDSTAIRQVSAATRFAPARSDRGEIAEWSAAAEAAMKGCDEKACRSPRNGAMLSPCRCAFFLSEARPAVGNPTNAHPTDANLTDPHRHA